MVTDRQGVGGVASRPEGVRAVRMKFSGRLLLRVTAVFVVLLLGLEFHLSLGGGGAGVGPATPATTQRGSGTVFSYTRRPAGPPQQSHGRSGPSSSASPLRRTSGSGGGLRASPKISMSHMYEGWSAAGVSASRGCSVFGPTLPPASVGPRCLRHPAGRLTSREVAAREAGGSRNPAVLWSYPGSGNSMLRLMLEQVSGRMTGSVYHKDEVMREVFVGEDFFGEEVLCVKSHEKVPDRARAVAEYPDVLLLVRHPFPTFWAEYARKTSTAANRHVAGVARASFDRAAWEVAAKDMARLWRAQVRGKLSPALHVERTIAVRFEDLADRVSGPATLQHVAGWLGVCNVTAEAAACAASQARHPLIKRVKQASDVRLTDALTPALMDALWTKVEATALRFGYTKYNWQAS